MSRSVNVSCSELDTNDLKKKELLFATLAHDLKNPVQAQLLSIKMLAEGTFGKLNSKQKEMLNIILESSNYMHDMLQSILDSYKFDNGVIYLVKKEFSAKELIQNCINEVKSFACNKNINILLDFKSDVLEVNADEIQLRRVISNILNNSLNYSYNDSDLIISVFKDNKNMIFCFENCSPEIPIEIKEHIFEKHVSGSQSGTGLGLYFVKKVIDAHNGKIYLDCNGTCNKFIFEIPLCSCQDASICW